MPTAVPTVERTPAPQVFEDEPDGELAVGITEPNPNLVTASAVFEPFDTWRRALEEMRPQYYRLVVDWAQIQPTAGGELILDLKQGGCMRDKLPCLGWMGVREQLRAIASRQGQEGGGWEAMVVLMGTPEWAARRPGGCERPGVTSRSRPPRDDALSDYIRLVEKLLDAARAEGADIRYWSAWNEPNHPFFISPQRPTCSGRAKSAAIAPYAAMVRALREALEAAPGEQEIVLGELAGLRKSNKPRYTSITEFIRGLPKDVVCSARIFGQHGYIGGPDPVDDAARALERRRCERPHEIWVTETGAGGPRSGFERDTKGSDQRRACRLTRRRLIRWYEDPRVTAAFQYTLREDDQFPTGLVTTDLTEAYPALREWQQWGTVKRSKPTDPPPERARCR